MKAIDFLKKYNVAEAERIIAEAPEWAEKYDTSMNEYRRRVKQLSYMIHEVNLLELKIELRQKALGRKLSFKERQSEKKDLENELKGRAQ